MKCKDIMRRPVQTLNVEATVQAAALRMKDANIGLIPICDAHGLALGVVTDRDIAIRVVAAGLSPRTTCESVMTTEIVSCGPHEDLEFVAQLMASRRKSRILVMDREDLVGIVSLSDLAAANIGIASFALHEVATREVLDTLGSTQPHS
jgi:CBS domain-containing protein